MHYATYVVAAMAITRNKKLIETQSVLYEKSAIVPRQFYATPIKI